MSEPALDLVIKNLRVARPRARDLETLDVGISAGKFARLAPSIDPAKARRVVDGRGRLALPGVVDAHTHMGIYRPLELDAESESRAAASGGVTTLLTYMRTGQYYLDKGGPYAAFYPEVLARSQGRYHVDYGYHLAPIGKQHIGEMELLLREFGVPSFKIFMFYGNHGLHGRSASQQQFLMIDEGERYDLAHFEFIMRELARLADEVPGARDACSLSLHCELGDILNAYTQLVEQDGKLSGLAAYSAARPAHSEGLAIFIAAYLADETRCPKLNLLHLSSRKAIEAALTMQRVFPHVDFKREVTIGHLLLDTDSRAAVHAKVNPPIRPREDVERLWTAVLSGDVDWIVSDHACCASAQKLDAAAPGDVFRAKSGFGGSEYLLSGLLSEGRRRGLGYNRIAELLSANPARRFGLHGKGDIAVGLDADLAIVDPDASFTVTAEGSPSGQGYTPFEGLELTGRVEATWLRGELVYDRSAAAPFPAASAPRGRYLRRPYGQRSAA